MANKRVKPEQLAAAFTKIVEEYEQDLGYTVEDVVKRSAQKGLSALRASSAARINEKYARNWTWTWDTVGRRLNPTAVIYSKVPGLPHLLEHGHALVNGGRYPGKPHIAPVEEEIERSFVSLMEYRLRDKI